MKNVSLKKKKKEKKLGKSMENKWSFLVAKIDSKTSTYATFDDILPDP